MPGPFYSDSPHDTHSIKKGKGGPRSRLNFTKVAAALRKYRGNYTLIGELFGMHRTTIMRFCTANPALLLIGAESKETMKDEVEARLYQDCMKDEPAYQTSRIFYLKTQAKDRGYVELTKIAPTTPDGNDEYRSEGLTLGERVGGFQQLVEQFRRETATRGPTLNGTGKHLPQ